MIDFLYQEKIHNLENILPFIIDYIHPVKFTNKYSVVDFNETSRKKYNDGFYLFTVDISTESHGIFIEKRSESAGVRFLMFDPNGQKYANKSNYHIVISHDRKNIEPDISISPKISWNNMGYCGLWTAVMSVFFSNVGKDRQFDNDNISTLYAYLDENHEYFIHDIYNFIMVKRNRNYTSISEVYKFNKYVIDKISTILEL
jgi:hypothetical protein